MKNGKEKAYSIDPGAVAMLLLKRSWAVMLCFLLSFIVAYFALEVSREVQYSASATMYISPGNEGASQPTDSKGSQASYAARVGGALLKTDAALERVIAALDELDGRSDGMYMNYSARDIKDMLTVSSTDGTGVTRITVSCASETAAVDIVNAFVEVAPEFIEGVVRDSYVCPIDRAVSATESEPTGLVLPALIAIAAAVAACIVISIACVLDTRVHTVDDISIICDIPVLGEIPCWTGKNSDRGYYSSDEQ